MKAICIKCWNPDAVVCMDLDGSQDFRCLECDEVFGCGDVRDALDAMQKGWAKLIGWAESYPAEEADEKADEKAA